MAPRLLVAARRVSKDRDLTYPFASTLPLWPAYFTYCLLAETFRNCADIAIISNTGGGVPPIFINNRSPYLLYYRDYRAPEDNNVFPLIVR